MHGADDPIPLDSAKTTAECLKAGFYPLERCGHVPYVERPERFCELLDRFLPRET